VTGLAVDPEMALREYLGRYGVAPLARLLSWARLTRFITAAAPGIGDILLVGKVWEAVTRRRDGRDVYQLVVLDAPPTGRIVPFLRAPETIAELARVGPIRHQSDRIAELLDDPARTALVVTCLPEELPVTETIEAVGDLAAAGLPLGPVVVNQVASDSPAGAGQLAALASDPSRLVAAAAEAGAELSPGAVATLVGEARDRQRVVARQRRCIKELRAGLPGVAVLELPSLPGGVAGVGTLRDLASLLLEAEPR
jgi:anion-transporting  ArsA/GET3 family ATPase